MRTKHNATLVLAVVLSLVVLLPFSAALELNSSQAVKYYNDQNLEFQIDTDGTINAYGDLDMQSGVTNNITNFFDTTACGTDEFVTRVFANGSYQCTDASSIDTDTDNQNLSEVLVQGNVANQTIEFQDGIQIGDADTVAAIVNNTAVGAGAVAEDITADDTGGLVAIGLQANASNFASVGIGRNALASGASGTAVGRLANATALSTTTVGFNSGAIRSYAASFGAQNVAAGVRSTTLGSWATANGARSTALGHGSEATADGAVAIGDNAIAANKYEATFGNLSGGELDLNITGNATIHGIGNVSIENGDLNLNSGTLHNVGGIAGCSASEYLAGDGTCTADSDSDNQNLSEVLVQGNVANTSIDMGQNNLIGLENLRADSGTSTLSIATSADTDMMTFEISSQDVSIPNGNLDLSGNEIRSVAKLNITNTSSNTQIADFTETGVTLHQPLSVESSGAMSVANGLELTDGTSNTIDSYSTMYLKTSSGSPSDIVLQPTGDVGVQANLDMADNNITNCDYINGVDCANLGATGSDNQNLQEVLVQGNTANTTIDMDTNDITNVGTGRTNITGTGDIEAGGNVEMNGNNPQIDMGNGVTMQRDGGHIVISDS